MELKSSDYFNIINNTIAPIYKLNVVKTNNDTKFMLDFFLKFISNTHLKNRSLSMDFEFNKSKKGGKEIAIFQILLEDDEIKKPSDVSNVFLFYPEYLKNSEKNILIQLLTTDNIIKILHGGESLDIPYLFNHLIKDKKLIYLFCKNLYDTKYICEYNHLLKHTKDKCKIYYFLKEMNVINSKQFDNLIENEKQMGPIWFIQLDIKNLSKHVILYSSFDVLYLKDLLNKFYKTNMREEIEILSEISSLNFLYRIAHPELLNSLEQISDLNTDIVYENNSKVQFLDIFNLYYYWYDDDKHIFTKIIEINFYKKFLQNFIKLIVYEKFTSNKLITNNYGSFSSSLNKTKINIVHDIRNKVNQFVYKLKSVNFGNHIFKFLDHINNSIYSDLYK